MDFLKNLTELNGVSGDENKVRDYIINKINDRADQIDIDSMGNLYAYKKGSNSNIKVMLAAHMDEVGLMVTGYSDMGMLKFSPVGGIDTRILLNKRVLVGDSAIPGIIGCKPVHLQEKDERTVNIKLKSMYIDIGASDREEAEKLVSLGDYIAFYSEYVPFGNGCVKAKALDDRVGCSILVDILSYDYEFDIVCCFTVQEEVGLRGARVAANRVQPDISIVVEGTTCSDVPGAELHQYSTQLGKGPALTIMDRTCIADKELLKLITKTAEKNDIPYQYKQTTTGGNDAGAIQTAGKGVRVVSISVPCRYIHTPVSVMKLEDYYNCKKLIHETLRNIVVLQKEVN